MDPAAKTVVAAAILATTACSAVQLEDLASPRPVPSRSCLVIGFLGGRDASVQVDSVGRGDGKIPPNVRHALNLYQDSGLVLEGEHPVEAEDPERTRVLGNWRFDYNRPPGSTISVGDLPLWKVIFRVAHAKMDRDPRVWESTRAMLTGACTGQDLPALATRLYESRGG